MAPKRPRYFTPNEVSTHNSSKDIWVSFLGKVYNLSPLVDAHIGGFCTTKKTTTRLKRRGVINPRLVQARQ